MPLASGTAYSQKQAALLKAANTQKKKKKSSQPSEAKRINNPFVTDASLRVRGLTGPTYQTGNFAKSLATARDQAEAEVQSGGMVTSPSDQLSILRQAEMGENVGMDLGEDTGARIRSAQNRGMQNLEDMKQIAFNNSTVDQNGRITPMAAPSASQYLTSNPLSKENRGKYTSSARGQKMGESAQGAQKALNEFRAKNMEAIRAGDPTVLQTLRTLEQKVVTTRKTNVSGARATGQLPKWKRGDSHITSSIAFNALGQEVDQQGNPVRDVPKPEGLGERNRPLPPVRGSLPTTETSTTTNITSSTDGSTDIVTPTTNPTESTNVSTGEVTTNTTPEIPSKQQGPSEPSQPDGALTGEIVNTPGGGSFGSTDTSGVMGAYGEALNAQDLYMQQAMDSANIEANARKSLAQRRYQMLLSQTNAEEMGYNIENMTTDQIKDLLVSGGVTPNSAEIDRIKAGGKAELDNLMESYNSAKTYLDIDKNALEREYNRALTEREKKNVQDDVRMRRLLGSFGGGVQLNAEKEVMNALEEGQRAKEDLISTFADKRSGVAQQAMDYAVKYSKLRNDIVSSTEDQIAKAYSSFTETLDKYLEADVTDVVEINKAMMEPMKHYVEQRAKYVTEGAKALNDLNQQAFENMMNLKGDQREEDKMNMEMTGYRFQGGEVVRDSSTGLPIPTFDRMKWNSEEDRKLSESTGWLYQNGAQVIDMATGKPVPTFDREKFVTQEDRMNRQMEMDQRQFNANYGLATQRLQLDYSKFLDDRQQQSFDNDMKKVEMKIAGNEILQKYMTPEDVMSLGVRVNNNGNVSSGALMAVNAVEKALKNVNKAWQCVQFVREIDPDLPGGLNSLADKVRNLVKSKDGMKAPLPGSVVVLDWNDPAKPGIGHVAKVTNVDEQKRTFDILDYNGAGGPYAVGTRTISMDDPKVKGYWMSPSLKVGQASAGGSTSGLPKNVATMFSNLTVNMNAENRKYAQETVDEFVQNGDVKGAENFVKNIAFQKMPVEQKNEAMAYDTTAAMADFILQNMDTKTAKGGVYEKFMNDTRKWANLSKDPAYAKVLREIAIVQAPLQNRIYGASLTGNEFKQGQQWLIQPDDTVQTIINKTRGMADFSKNVVKNSINASGGQLYSTSGEMPDFTSATLQEEYGNPSGQGDKTPWGQAFDYMTGQQGGIYEGQTNQVDTDAIADQYK